MPIKNLITTAMEGDAISFQNTFDEELKARIGKALTERIEDMQEVSKETLISYVKKAPDNAVKTKFQAIAHQKRAIDAGGDTRDMHFDLSDKLHRRYNNRMTGINKAVDKIVKEAYNPLKPLVRSISFNDFQDANGAEDYAKVKKIKWPYGIEVKYDDKNLSVTFKTAKMKTVAQLLDKVVDFGAVSAGEVLDLPAELMGSYINPSKGNHSIHREVMKYKGR